MRSIFLKLILTVVLFGILINASIWVFFRYSSDVKPKGMARVYINKMMEYLVHDIGFPPDTMRAKTLAEELNVNIRFQSHDFNWATSDYIPMLEELAASEDFKKRFPHQENFRMEFDGRFFHVYKSPRGVYIIAPPTPQDFFNPERAVFIIVLLISFIFITLYLWLRWLFNPLRHLSSAVNEIAKGNYDVQIPVNRRDELGRLADSTREMAAKIKQNIKAKEQLLIDVSHELRTPLTRMKLGLEVGSTKKKINEDIDEMEKMISGLIEGYRAEGTTEKLNLEVTDIGELMREVIKGEPRAHLGGASLPQMRIKVDREKLRTVFRNLLDNALKYSSGTIDVSLAESPSSVILSVKDYGIGISEEDLKYIFEPFYRADPSRSKKTGGYGLGLSICKKIVEAHGGTIEIRSQPNQGTQAKVTLPRS
jgi:signal transduction histidine kinase